MTPTKLVLPLRHEGLMTPLTVFKLIRGISKTVKPVARRCCYCPRAEAEWICCPLESAHDNELMLAHENHTRATLRHSNEAPRVICKPGALICGMRGSQPAAEANGDEAHISVSRPRHEPKTLSPRQAAIRKRFRCCVPSFKCFEHGWCGWCSRVGG